MELSKVAGFLFGIVIVLFGLITTAIKCFDCSPFLKYATGIIFVIVGIVVIYSFVKK